MSTIEVKYRISLKTAKRAMAFTGIEILSDEDIINKLSNTTVDLSDSKDKDLMQAELAFALLAIGIAFAESE